MRVLVSAGEPSGDRHAADVVRALRAAVPNLEIEGVGGRCMETAGVRLLHRLDSLCATGVYEALAHLPSHLRLLQLLRRRMKAEPYDLALLVDYPGFHLRVAAAASARGIPVCYYVAPQLWAWGAWRSRELRNHIRQLAVILPFEERFFADRGIPAVFVGHPLLDRPPGPDRGAARRALSLSSEQPVIGLFPGSRAHEISRHWPLFRDTGIRLRAAAPEAALVVAAIEGQAYPGAAEFRLWRQDAGTVFAAADAGICKAGTTTIEAALAGMPMVIAHRVHPATYAIARRMVRSPHIGLVNLLAGQPVAPELIQHHASPQNMVEALLPLLDPQSQPARTQRRHFEQIRYALGRPGVAARVAGLAHRLVA